MKKIIVLLGATSVGKSKTAIALAKELNTSIISADAFQIYKGLNIGTAKSTIAEMNGICHYMIDIVHASEQFNSYLFTEKVKTIINEITDANKIPIICGGTGLFIDSLIYGLDYNNDSCNLQLRANLTKQLNDEGKEALYKQLLNINPSIANSFHMNNTHRLIRELEIALSGNSKETTKLTDKQPKYDAKIIILNRERDALYNNINTRVDKMIKDGLIEEIESLLNSGINWEHQSMKAIGYKELKPFFIGCDTKENCIEKIKQNSRNYAKRQITYFKRMKNATWLQIDNLNNDEILSNIINLLQ